MSPPPNGVLLVNLGTPRSPATADVRRYLREFLCDPRVLNGMSTLARAALVHLVIAPFRAPRSAAAYRKIWTEAGSPLLVHGLALRDALQEALGPSWAVALGMRYSEPSIRAALEELAARSPGRLIVLPLFPQYASASTGSALARAQEVARELPDLPALSMRGEFHAAAGFAATLAEVARPQLDDFKPDHLLLSYHGLPESQIRAADSTGRHCLERADCCAASVAANRHCYRAQCLATSRALARELDLEDGAWSTAFQSRLGRRPWIEPFTDHALPELAQRGVKRLAVACPSFVADCLETLEEIGIRARAQWHALGGDAFELIACPNAHPRWVATVAAWLEENGDGA